MGEADLGRWENGFRTSLSGRPAGPLDASWWAVLVGRGQSLSATIERALESEPVASLIHTRRIGVCVSAGIHVGVLIACLMTWPQVVPAQAEIPALVPVDLVAFGEETNIAAMRRPDLAPSQAAPPSKPQAAFEMKLFPRTATDVGDDQTKPQASASASSDRKPDPKDAKIGDENTRKMGGGTAMTVSASDALRSRIAQCWRIGRGQESIVVTFELFFDEAGSIERPPRLVNGTDTPTAAAAAEAVRRAIYTCAPYKLPISRFREWHQITLTFDPRMMMLAH